MIEKEGKMQVEITGAWWEAIDTDDGEVDIAKITFKDSHDNEDELSMWLSPKIEEYGKYKGKPQFEGNLDRLTKAGMEDGNPANIKQVIGKTIMVFGKLKEKNDREYYTFYWQDGATQAKSSDVLDRLKKLRGQTQAMAGTPVDGDDDNLPF